MIRFSDSITTDYVVHPATNRPTHTNANIMKFPHHRKQIMGASLPAGLA